MLDQIRPCVSASRSNLNMILVISDLLFGYLKQINLNPSLTNPDQQLRCFYAKTLDIQHIVEGRHMGAPSVSYIINYVKNVSALVLNPDIFCLYL